jgi:hypothetical protein
MVWCPRQDRLGDLPDLWPLLPGEGLGESPQKKTLVDSRRSGCGSHAVRMVDLSFPA